jgi:DNA-binding transcriptional ArsR family regulator
MPKKGLEQELRYAAPVFAALGDDVRLVLVARMCTGGPLSITKLSEGTRVTRQAVTKHLRVLAKAGLATCSRSGREQIWVLEPDPLDEARRCLDLIAVQWDGALARLKSFAEQAED